MCNAFHLKEGYISHHVLCCLFYLLYVFLRSLQIKKWVLERTETLISLIWHIYQAHVWYLYQIDASWSFTLSLPLNNNPKSADCLRPPVFYQNGRYGHLSLPEIHTHSPNCQQAEWFSLQHWTHSTGVNRKKTKHCFSVVPQVSDFKSSQREISATFKVGM